jgi:MFS family permease
VRTYGRLLATPGARRFVPAGFLGRLPMSMQGLGVLVLVSSMTGSYGLAGAVSAALTIAGAFGAPVLGGLVDRLGQRTVLLPSVFLHCAALGSLVTLTVRGAPTWTLFVAAAATGALLPPVSSMVRARWTHILGGGTSSAHQAYAFESVVDELVFMIGPVLVTTLSTVVARSAGLLVSGGLLVVGGLLLSMQHRTEPPVVPRQHDMGRSAFSVGGVRMLSAVCVLVGVIFGTIDVAIVAFAAEQDRSSLAGVLLACVALGSGTSGVWYGSRTWRRPLQRRLVMSACVLAVSMGSMALATSVLGLALLAFVAGLAVSPTLIACFALVEGLVPAHVLTEGFTWVSTSLGLGVGLGVTLAGRLVDAYGASTTFLLCPCAALLAAALATAGRQALSTGSPLSNEAVLP